MIPILNKKSILSIVLEDYGYHEAIFIRVIKFHRAVSCIRNYIYNFF